MPGSGTHKHYPKRGEKTDGKTEKNNTDKCNREMG
jgi:hypothetical protein